MPGFRAGIPLFYRKNILEKTFLLPPIFGLLPGFYFYFFRSFLLTSIKKERYILFLFHGDYDRGHDRISRELLI